MSLLALFAALDVPLDSPWHQPLQFLRPVTQVWLAVAKEKKLLFLRLPAIAGGFRLLHEVGGFIFALPSLWHDS